MTVSEALAKSRKELKPYISNALRNDVFENVREIMHTYIQEDVYSAYSPKVYKRRGSSGLGNINSIVYKSSSPYYIFVKTIARPNPYGVNEKSAKYVYKNSSKKELDVLVEYGHGNPYNYDFSSTKYAYLEPRPFARHTYELMEDTGFHVLAFVEGLTAEGINAEVVWD